MAGNSNTREQTFLFVINTCKEILLKGSFRGSYAILHRNIGAIVARSSFQELCDRLKGVIWSHIDVIINQIPRSNNDFLQALSTAWANHQECLQNIRIALLRPLRDIKSVNSVIQLYNGSKERFTKIITSKTGVRDRYIHNLLDLFCRVRRGEEVLEPLLVDVSRLLVCLERNDKEVYEKKFVAPFVEQCINFHRKETITFFAANSESTFIEYVQQRICDERRWGQHVDRETLNNIINTLESMRTHRLEMIIITQGRVKK